MRRTCWMLLWPFMVLFFAHLNAEESPALRGKSVVLHPMENDSLYVELRPQKELAQMGRNGLFLTIWNNGITPFTFSTKDIRISQGTESWQPLYILTAEKEEFLRQALTGNRREGVSQEDRDTIVFAGGRQSPEPFPDGAPSLLHCYLALKDPVPDYRKPLEIHFRDKNKVVTYW